MTTPPSALLHLCDWCGAPSDQPCLTGKGGTYKDGRSHHGGLCKCPTRERDSWPEATALLASLDGHADYCCRHMHAPSVSLLTCCTCGATDQNAPPHRLVRSNLTSDHCERCLLDWPCPEASS